MRQVDKTRFLFQALTVIELVRDVGVRAAPNRNATLIVADRMRARQKPAYLPSTPRSGNVSSHSSPVRKHSEIFFTNSVDMFGMMRGAPAPTFRLFGRRPGIIEPSLIVPKDMARLVRHPCELRDAIRERAKFERRGVNGFRAGFLFRNVARCRHEKTRPPRSVGQRRDDDLPPSENALHRRAGSRETGYAAASCFAKSVPNKRPRLLGPKFDPWLAKQRGEGVRLQESEPGVIYEADASVNINQFDTIDARREQTIAKRRYCGRNVFPAQFYSCPFRQLTSFLSVPNSFGNTRTNRRPGSTHEIAAAPVCDLATVTGQAAASRFVEALRSKNSA